MESIFPKKPLRPAGLRHCLKLITANFADDRRARAGYITRRSIRALKPFHRHAEAYLAARAERFPAWRNSLAASKRRGNPDSSSSSERLVASWWKLPPLFIPKTARVCRASCKEGIGVKEPHRSFSQAFLSCPRSQKKLGWLRENGFFCSWSAAVKL